MLHVSNKIKLIENRRLIYISMAVLLFLSMLLNIKTYQELSNSEEFAIEYSLQETESRAKYLSDYFSESEVILSNLRSVMLNLTNAGKFDRELMNNMLLSYLNAEKNTLSLWIFLEPNAFDLDEDFIGGPGTRPDGRYAPWFYYNKERTSIIRNTCSTDQQKFYQYPERLMREVLLEPYQTVKSGDRYFITLAQPIINNEFQGAMGIDWFWGDFNEILSEKPFGGRGSCYLVSANGTILSHNDLSRLGTEIDSLTLDHLSSAANGEKLVEHVKESGYYRVICDFKIPYTETDWYIVNEIPDSNNFYTVIRQNKFRWRVGLLLFVLFLILLYVVLHLFDFLAKDRNQRQKEFSQTINSAYEGVCVIDKHYRYRQFNNAFHLAIKYLIGVEIREGGNALEGLPDEFRKQNKGNFDRALAGHYFIDEQEHLGRRYRHYYNPVFDDENEVESFVIRIVDITEKLKNEEELQQYRSYLQGVVREKIEDLQEMVEAIKDSRLKQIENEKNATLGLLSYGLANELSSQVNFVVGNITPLRKDLEDIRLLLELTGKVEQLDKDEFIRLLDQQLQKLDTAVLLPEINTLVEGVEAGANRMLEIVNNFNEFVRPDRQARFENINRGLELAVKFIKPQLSPGVTIDLQADPELPSTFCDIGKLNDTFLSLLDYVTRGTNIGNVTIVTGSADLESIVVRITNDQKNISDDEIEKLFDPLQCIKGEPSDRTVNLALCNKIIQAHGGEMKIKKTGEKGGFVIIIRIPVLLTPMESIKDEPE